MPPDHFSEGRVGFLSLGVNVITPRTRIFLVLGVIRKKSSIGKDAVYIVKFSSFV